VIPTETSEQELGLLMAGQVKEEVVRKAGEVQDVQ